MGQINLAVFVLHGMNQLPLHGVSPVSYSGISDLVLKFLILVHKAS